MKNMILIGAVLVMAGLHAEDSAMPFDGHDSSAMDACVGNFLFQGGKDRYVTREFQDGKTAEKLKIYANKDFTDYNSKAGTVAVQGNRFWLIGGEGTIDNKEWQSVPMILTGTVDSATGVLSGMKKVSPLPFAAKHGRCLIVNNMLYYLGGVNHNELIAAEIKPEGELGEWKTLPPYPTIVAEGGFACLNGVLYANGRSTWTPGSSKMYALKLKDGEPAGKWEQVDSPENAQGYMFVRDNNLYYFDTISGNVYKTSQDADGIQLKDWTVAGTMPCPPKTEGVTVVEVPNGYLVVGGFLPKGPDGKFNGFFRGNFLPFTALK